MIVYEAKAEDLTHLGGPMGSEYVTDASLGIFSTLEEAKKACRKHYNQSRGPIKWKKKDTDEWCSQDLGYVMYRILGRVIVTPEMITPEQRQWLWEHRHEKRFDPAITDRSLWKETYEEALALIRETPTYGFLPIRGD